MNAKEKYMKKFALALAAVSAFSAVSANAEIVVADTDGNGAFSMEELMVSFPGLTEDAFKAADLDADGAISADELTAAEAAFTALAPAAEAAATDAAAATTEAAPAADATATDAAAPVVADADANTTFSLAEVQAAYADATEEAFKAADLDASGELSAEELAAAVAANAFAAK
jgi:EF hand